MVDKKDNSRLGEIKSINSKYLHRPPNKVKVTIAKASFRFSNCVCEQYVVSREWVEESVSQQEDLDEREFFV